MLTVERFERGQQFVRRRPRAGGFRPRRQIPAAKPAPKSRLPTLRENAVEIRESDSERFPRPRLQLSSEQAEVHLDYILPIGLETTFGFPAECRTTGIRAQLHH